jgi:hypothetical protein
MMFFDDDSDSFLFYSCFVCEKFLIFHSKHSFLSQVFILLLFEI